MFKDIYSDKEYWLYDLNTTIYSHDTKIFDQIDLRMKKYISRLLKISESEAFKIQKLYYKEFGTTLSGLMKNHNVDSDHFLEYVHKVNLEKLTESRDLVNSLSQLPGKKIIYTNGDSKHAENVLNKLNIKNLFDDIFDIKKSSLIPKPNKESLERLIKFHDLNPRKTVYFEDIEINLKNAYDFGITTFLIGYNKRGLKNSYVNYSFNTILSALNFLKKE